MADHGRPGLDSNGYVVVAQAEAGDINTRPTQPVSPHTKAPLGPVLACVAVASLGAFAFGYHLGVVNGPLGAIAADLGFAENAALQGMVCSLPASTIVRSYADSDSIARPSST